MSTAPISSHLALNPLNETERGAVMGNGNFPSSTSILVALINAEAALFDMAPEQFREVVGQLAEPAARRFGARLFFGHVRAIIRAARDGAEMDINPAAMLCQLDTHQRDGYLLAWRWWSAVHVVGGDFDGVGLDDDVEHGGEFPIAAWDSTPTDDAAGNAALNAHLQGAHLFLDHLRVLFDSARAASAGGDSEISIPDLAAPCFELMAHERAGYLQAWGLWSVIVEAGAVPTPDWLCSELEKAMNPASPNARGAYFTVTLPAGDASGDHHGTR